MGKTQEVKSPGGSERPSPGNCSKCNQSLTDAEFVLIGSNKFHTACFNCHKCSKSICRVPHCVHADNYYCEDCYFELFGNRCAKCNEFIKGGFIQALGQQWHKNCFLCTTCQKPFEGKRFRKFEGNPYCENCYQKLFKTYCATCQQEIQEGQVFSAINKTFHLQCFQCNKCSRVLSDGQEFYPQETGVFCHDCFVDQYGKKCELCHNKITGDFIDATTEGSNQEALYHVECFNCSVCGQNLADSGWFRENGRIYCENDVPDAPEANGTDDSAVTATSAQNEQPQQQPIETN